MDLVLLPVSCPSACPGCRRTRLFLGRTAPSYFPRDLCPGCHCEQCCCCCCCYWETVCCCCCCCWHWMELEFLLLLLPRLYYDVRHRWRDIRNCDSYFCVGTGLLYSASSSSSSSPNTHATAEAGRREKKIFKGELKTFSNKLECTPLLQLLTLLLHSL